MGTRGTYGFRRGGTDKLTYNHYDSYPDGLGADIVSFVKTTSVNEMNAIYDRLKLVSNEKKPTKAQVKECEPWTNLSVSEQSTADWYCLLREAQGDLDALKSSLRYMLDDGEFIKDSLFCEHGYIINLDENVLEYWSGFQTKPGSMNRYGSEQHNGYYPCALLLKFPLDAIPEDAVAQMEKASQDDYEANHREAS